MVPTVDHNVLSTLSDDDRRAVLATMVRRRYRKGETLFHEGETGDLLYVLERGRVAIRVSTSLGDVATLIVLGSGASFGEQALLDHGSTVRTASAVALEAVEARTLQRQHFDDLRRLHPSVDRMLVEALAAQVRRLSTHLVEALYSPVEVRLVRRLAEVAMLYGDSGPIEIPLRQDDLASMAGTTRPTANRVLRQLEDEGIVELRRGTLHVLDAASLAARAR